jgi:hypothetical protein
MSCRSGTTSDKTANVLEVCGEPWCWYIEVAICQQLFWVFIMGWKKNVEYAEMICKYPGSSEAQSYGS